MTPLLMFLFVLVTFRRYFLIPIIMYFDKHTDVILDNARRGKYHTNQYNLLLPLNEYYVRVIDIRLERWSLIDRLYNNNTIMVSPVGKQGGK